MPSKKGRGTPVTPSEKHRYDQLRAAGWSPEHAAEAIGRSKSWGYLYEAEKRGPLRKHREPRPAENLSDAVDLICAIKIDEDDQEPAFEIVDRFGMAVMPLLANVAWLLAWERAININNHLKDMLDPEMAKEVDEAPITAEEVLCQIPVAMDRHLAGKPATTRWMPARAERWMDRLLKAHPEFAQIEAEMQKVYDSGGDVEAGMAAIDKLIEEGEFSG